MNYPINEIFETIQGEGYFAGTPAVFIRLQGCNVGCAWCDTKHSWEQETIHEVLGAKLLTKTQEGPSWAFLSIDEILAFYQTQNFQAKHIVITGGEPCLYNLEPLTLALEASGFICQIETSGTAQILCSSQTFVTVSPKVNMKSKLEVLPAAIVRANEIKHPVAREKDIENLLNLLASAALDKELLAEKIIALQPISQKQDATSLCIQACIKHNWRLSIQIHKYLQIA